MKPLLTALTFILSFGSASAQVVGEAASAGQGASAAGAAVTAVPNAIGASALNPGSALGLQGTLSAPAGAPAPGAPIPALAASAIIPIDPAKMPAVKKDYTPMEWAGMVRRSKDEGTKAVLRSMAGDNASSPRLAVKLANGESVSGKLLGVADGKMIFEMGGKLVGLKMDGGGIAEVRREVDIMFDGASPLQRGDVLVHDRPALVDPFKDLAKYVGRTVDIEMLDNDDKKRFSLDTVSGRIEKADGNSIVLDGPKGKTTIQREFHIVEKVVLRIESYSSKGNIGSSSDVAGKIPDGGPVEVVLSGGKTVVGRFFGVRKDAQGSFVLIEVEEAGGTRFRAFRDFFDLRTPGFSGGKSGPLPGGETIYDVAP